MNQDVMSAEFKSEKNRLKEDLKNKHLNFSEEYLNNLVRKMLAFKNYIPRVAIFGSSGVGKSSLCNVLFGGSEKVTKESHIGAGTTEVQEISIDTDLGKMILLDFPGIGENIEKHEEYSKVYKKELDNIDLIVWVIKSDVRALKTELDFYTGVLIPLMDEKNELPLIFVLSQTDKISPAKEWDHDEFEPGDTQKINIEKRKNLTAKSFIGINSKNICAIAIEEEPYQSEKRASFGIPELLERIVEVVPNEKKYAFARQAADEFKTEKTKKTVEDGFFEALWVAAIDKFGKVAEFVGEMIEENKDTIKKVVVSAVSAWWNKEYDKNKGSK